MNKIVLLGRLVRDPEVRYTTTGKVVCQFTLAVDRPFTNQDGQKEADFINIVVWGKVGELAGNSLAKGHRVLIDGRLQIRSYDGKDGNKRYVTEVVANSMEFIERKGYQSGVGHDAGGYSAAASTPSPMDSFGEGAGQSQVPFDDEIPF